MLTPPMWSPTPAGEGSLESGRVVGPYRIAEELGRGGMGIVFRAVRLDDPGAEVALKLLRRELAGDDVYRRRFYREARAAAEIEHPNIVPVLEAGEVDGRPYLATTYVAGGSVSARIAARGPLPVEEAVRVVLDAARGLDALHARGIVHRDVKSSNVMLDLEGRALLTDFGLAKGRADTVLTRPGQLMGTLDYVAPELIRGAEASPASDVYALGCLAFECLAGEPPFASRSALQVGVAHLEEEPPDLAGEREDVSPELAWAVARALQKDPAERLHSATAYARLVLAAARTP
jgi:serine/threonine-protein kinase